MVRLGLRPAPWLEAPSGSRGTSVVEPNGADASSQLGKRYGWRMHVVCPPTVSPSVDGFGTEGD